MDLFKDIELQTGKREFKPDTLFLHPVVKLFAMSCGGEKEIGYYPDDLENLVVEQSPSPQVKLVGWTQPHTKKTQALLFWGIFPLFPSPINNFCSQGVSVYDNLIILACVLCLSVSLLWKAALQSPHW